MKKIAIIAVSAALTLAACATGPTYTQQQADSAIAAAEQKTKQAAKVNYEWRDTGDMIKKAKEAAKKGDFDTAVKLASKAEKQSTMALQQYEENKSAGPRF